MRYAESPALILSRLDRGNDFTPSDSKLFPPLSESRCRLEVGLADSREEITVTR